MAEYNNDDRKILLDTSRSSISYGLKQHQPLPIKLEDYDQHLQEERACFVTLDLHEHLRGCIGSLIANRPLIVDVSMNAYSAAFGDPRFSALTEPEYKEISLHISVLSNPKPMSFESEKDLISQLQPGIDGLILTEKGCRGTFLPSVWEQIPDPEVFLQHLKNKAGLPINYWSPTVHIDKYSAEMIE